MKTYKSRLRTLRQLDHTRSKRIKLGVLEALIHAQEHSPNPDLVELKSLKRRANEVRNQLSVMST